MIIQQMKARNYFISKSYFSLQKIILVLKNHSIIKAKKYLSKCAHFPETHPNVKEA